MNLLKFLIIAPVIWLFLATGCTPKNNSNQKTVATDSSHQHEEGYWTCTMHPQVHQNEPGKCPICGMPLVHVDKKIHVDPQTEEITGIEPTTTQLRNANISKFTVSRKDFIVTLHLSGRVISAKEISFQIYESDLAIIRPGIEISGSTSPNPDIIIKGHITSVDTIVDPSSRTVRANAILQSAVTNFVAETSFYGQAQSTLKNQISVPQDAVLHAGKRDLVYLFTLDGKLQPQEVRLGIKSNGEYQILSGLKDGDVVSAGANFLIDSEAKIRGL